MLMPPSGSHRHFIVDQVINNGLYSLITSLVGLSCRVGRPLSLGMRAGRDARPQAGKPGWGFMNGV
jgi:hypothetical protein